MRPMWKEKTVSSFPFSAISHRKLTGELPACGTVCEKGAIRPRLRPHPLLASSLLFCLLFAGMLTFPTSAAARGRSPTVYQGIIVQVDSTNNKDITFSLLNRRGVAITFHLIAGTRFKPHQSAAQLKVNLFATVTAKTGKGGELDATFIQLQGQNRGALTLQGVVASTNANQQIITFAL